MLIYDDGTYTCLGWDSDDYSEWRIIDDIFHHKHAGSDEFHAQEYMEVENREYARKILEALVERDLLQAVVAE